MVEKKAKRRICFCRFFHIVKQRKQRPLHIRSEWPTIQELPYYCFKQHRVSFAFFWTISFAFFFPSLPFSLLSLLSVYLSLVQTYLFFIYLCLPLSICVFSLFVSLFFSWTLLFWSCSLTLSPLLFLFLFIFIPWKTLRPSVTSCSPVSLSEKEALFERHLTSFNLQLLLFLLTRIQVKVYLKWTIFQKFFYSKDCSG